MKQPALIMDEVTVRFGGLLALDRFSMEVEAGSIHALIGPNGAGKSTAFNAISRFYSLAGGQITYLGRNISQVQAHQLSALGISRTFQNIESCKRLTVLETVLVGMSHVIPNYIPFLPTGRRQRAEQEAVQAAEHLLERSNLIAFRNTRADQLDFGRLKMLDVTRALAAKPSILLLDEPAAGLRNREIAALEALLLEINRDHGITIVLVEHVMSLVMSLAQSITVLSFGRKIAEGRPSSIRNDPGVIEAYLGKSHA